MSELDDQVLEELVAPVLAAPRAGALAPSPYSFLFTGEDWLRLTATNGVFGNRIAVHYRMQRPGAPAHASRHVLQMGAPYVTTSAEFTLGEGYLLNATVFMEGSNPTGAQAFVTLRVIRGRGPNATVLGTIVQGYITEKQDLGWPGSPISDALSGRGAERLAFVSQPAPGQDLAQIIPSGARWEVLSIAASFTADATVFGREALALGQTGGVPLWQVPQPLRTEASRTSYYYWAQGLEGYGASILFVGTAPLPRDYPISGPGAITVHAPAKSPTDQWSAAHIRIREWLEVT